MGTQRLGLGVRGVRHALLVVRCSPMGRMLLSCIVAKVTGLGPYRAVLCTPGSDDREGDGLKAGVSRLLRPYPGIAVLDQRSQSTYVGCYNGLPLYRKVA